MLSRWTEWFRRDSTSQASRPRNKGRRFRGKFEHLEPRTVLSASLGPVPVDAAAVAPPLASPPPIVGFVAVDFAANTVTVVVWAEVPSAWQHPAFETLAQARSDAWGNPVRALAGETWHDERPWGPSDPMGHVVVGGSPGVDGQVGLPTGGSTAGAGQLFDKPPQALSSGPPAAPVTTPNLVVNLTSPPAGYTVPKAYNDRMAREVAAAASYFASLASYATYSSNMSATPQPTLTTRATAFAEYAPDALLLAVDGSATHDADMKDQLDDRLDADARPANHFASDDALAADQISESLDALARQRRAIDAVLAELHDIELPADAKATAKRAAEPDPRDAPATTPADEPARADTTPVEVIAATEPLAPAAPVDGGMVLLEATGDANSSAYDLVAVYSQDVLDHQPAPLSVEATVGIYQSIDVGTDRRVAAMNDAQTAAIP